MKWYWTSGELEEAIKRCELAIQQSVQANEDAVRVDGMRDSLRTLYYELRTAKRYEGR